MNNRAHPAPKNPRQSKNLQHLKNVQLSNGAAVRSSDNVFVSLRATQLAGSKPVLPAELIATILDYLPVPDLLRSARASRRLQEMVYDDSRWIQKLKSMGAWNDGEARQRFEEGMKRKAEAKRDKEVDEARRSGVNRPGNANGVPDGRRRHAGSVTLFDAGVEEDRYRESMERPRTSPHRRRQKLDDGFDDLTISPNSPSKTLAKVPDPNTALDVFDRVRSVRGQARQEFGKIYGALGPIYLDLARSQSHASALIFRTYRDPEQQAQILANLKRFAQCDTTQGALKREHSLDSMIVMFENAVLREFEQGCAASDVDGRMHRYAHVLVTLNGGNAGLDAFVSNNPIMARTTRIGNPLDCLEAVAPGHVDLNPSQAFFERLAGTMVEQASVIDRTFPHTIDVLTPFLSRLCEDTLSEYLTTLFDEAHGRGIETYVKAVSGTFGQALRFVASLVPTKASPSDFRERSKQAVVQCFQKHIDLYLAEELTVFRTKSRNLVTQWEKELSDQEESTESFFMANVNRQAAKRDFLSSFKKVLMMPVNILPAFPSATSSAKPATVVSKSSANLDALGDHPGGRPRTPTLTSTTPPRSATPAQDQPTTELAAKAAIMNSKLEGIKSLFSIEVALNLTHLAKASIERAALMVQMGDDYAKEAKEQCGVIFVTMLDLLGNRHVKNGFDKAVTHLGNYDPREVRKFRGQTQGAEPTEADAQTGVEPLVTFLELVNVGDLIQQMIDVFYAQEMVGAKLTDRDDFLDPSVKEKKKFEQMLDERVAAGLNKGIDVLMDEVEYICATTQTPADFNPAAPPSNNTEHSSAVHAALADIGPSPTARQVVDTVSGHHSMLVGSTDKTMLDIFTQEVGLRLFGVLCKHLKRQRVSAAGAIKLIADLNHYHAFVSSLRQKPLQPYYQALREMAQIYLVHVDPPGAYFSGGAGKRGSFLGGGGTRGQVQARELATIIADSQRYHGVFPAEEVYEFAERRADWYLVKGDVERAMYGVGCSVM